MRRRIRKGESRSEAVMVCFTKEERLIIEAMADFQGFSLSSLLYFWIKPHIEASESLASQFLKERGEMMVKASEALKILPTPDLVMPSVANTPPLAPQDEELEEIEDLANFFQRDRENQEKGVEDEKK